MIDPRDIVLTLASVVTAWCIVQAVLLAFDMFTGKK